MWPRSSAISGRSPSSRSTARKSSAPGPRPPASALRRRVPRRNRPVGDEAAEVVDAGEVDELEGAPEPLAPPVEAGRAVDRPVVQRVPPALAGRAERVGRRAGDLAAREQLRPAIVIGAAVGDVDRHVADQPDAALGRVGPQRPPLPLEAHLVGERLRAGEARPAAGPEGMARDEVLDLAGRDPRGRPGQELRGRREGRRRPVRRAELVGRPERQDLPPRLACRLEPVDEAVRIPVQLPGRERGRMEEDAGRARELHVLILPHQ